jgi:hypothetical protein
LSAIGASLPTLQESHGQVRDHVGLLVKGEVAAEPILPGGVAGADGGEPGLLIWLEVVGAGFTVPTGRYRPSDQEE